MGGWGSALYHFLEFHVYFADTGLRKNTQQLFLSPLFCWSLPIYSEPRGAQNPMTIFSYALQPLFWGQRALKHKQFLSDLGAVIKYGDLESILRIVFHFTWCVAQGITYKVVLQAVVDP